MIDSRTLAGLPPVMLFLKATVKKQIFVPSHTRHDGSFVAGHYKWVHVSDDHDEHKVLAGQGSHSQKIAHAKLSKLDSFNQLPHDHKVAVVLAHATDHQNMDSANARVSTLVKKILSGEKPTPSEWKAWGYVDNDKREKAFSAVAEAGKGAFFQNSMDTAAVNEGHQARTDAVSPAADAPPAAPPAAEKPVPEPEKVPAKAAPEPGADHAKVKMLLGAAGLPSENVNAKHFNAKLASIKHAFEAGDIKALLGASYGTNTYGKKAAKLANEVLAVLGSKETVQPGQKAGTHAAAAGDKAVPSAPAPAPKVVAATATEKPAAADMGNPITQQNQQNQPARPPKVVGAAAAVNPVSANSPAKPKAPHIVGSLAAKEIVTTITDKMEQGDAKTIEFMLMNLPNSTKLKWGKVKQYGVQAIAYVNAQKGKPAGAAATPAAAATPVAGAPTAEQVATLSENELQDIFNAADAPASMTMDMVKASAKAGDINGVQAVLNALPPNGWPKTKVAINKIIALMKEKQTKTTFTMSAGTPINTDLTGKKPSNYLAKIKKDGGDVGAAAQAWMDANPGAWDEINDALKKIGMPEHAKFSAAAFGFPDDAPKEGDTKVENGKTYALKDGHWHLVGADLDAQMADAGSLGGAQVTADLYLETHGHTPANYEKVSAALAKQGYMSLVPMYKQHLWLEALDKTGGVVSLEESEIPFKPPGASSKYYNDAQKFALAGNMAELKKLHTVLVNDGYASTHPVVMKMIDQLAAKQAGKGMPPAAPVAPASAALSPDEIHAYSSKVDGAYANTAKELAAAGDMAGLQAHIDMLHGLSYPHTAGYAKDLHAKMQAKSKGGAAVVGSTPAMALHPGELPYVDPNSVSSAEKMGIAGVNKAALDGNKESLDKLINHLENGSNPASPVLAHAKKVQALMQAKAGGAAGGSASPKLTDEEIAALPKPSGGNAYVGYTDYANDLASNGDIAGVEDYVKQLADNGYAANAEYAKTLAELMKKKSGGATLETGPKEGDTKQGADGMLVFKDGRWHKVKKEEPAGLSIEEIKKIKPPGASSKFANDVTALAKAGDIDGLKQLMKDMKGYKVPATRKFLKAAIAALEAKGLKGTKSTPKKKSPGAGTTAAAAASAASAAMPVTEVQSVKVGEISALVADKWEQTGPQKGSNPGGKFKDGSGQEWYCKFPGDDNVVKNELLAAKFYEMLGAKVPSLRLVKKDGQLGIASKWVDGIKKGSADELAAAPGAHGAFVFDAWLANWDVVGLSNDNLMLDKEGKALRVDVGGSLVYRAQGEEKGAAFGDNVTELNTLIDAAKNDKSAAVFKGISKADLQAGGAQLAKMKNDQIEKLVDLFGPGTAAQRTALVAKLQARRVDILKKLNIADPWNKPKPDITKLRVNQDDLPKPFDFFHHPDKNGGPLSSKDHFNKQNTIDDAALIDFAKQGNLQALKDYQYEAFTADGAPLGKKPITEHPSKHIKEHWAYCVELLQQIAYPSVEGLDMPPLNSGGTVEEVAAAAGFFHFGESIETIPAEKRLGFWMKLAHAGDDYKDLIPKNQHWLQQSVVAASKSAWAKVSLMTKAYIYQVQKNGWINHIYSKGDKKVDLYNGNSGLVHSGDLQPMVDDLYKNAKNLDEGLKLTRWMSVKKDMVDQLLGSKSGLIFQNTNSMCTSYSPDWHKTQQFGDGSCLMNIVCAKGAKGLHSFASGAFGKEYEITTLPGARFILLEAKKGNISDSNGVEITCLMLPPDDNYLQDMANQVK